MDDSGSCCKLITISNPPQVVKADSAKASGRLKVVGGFAVFVVWWIVYARLEPFSKWLTVSVLRLPLNSRLGSAVQFFVFDAPKVMMLLMLVVFGVGIVRSFFTPERTRAILARPMHLNRPIV